MTCTLPKHRIPLAALLVFFLLGCMALEGCSFPKRTFVADEEPTPRAPVSETPSRTVEREPAHSPQPSTVTGTTANQEKSFAWPNWLGPFSPKKPEPQPIEPPKRIPLPRTDRPLHEQLDGAKPETTPLMPAFDR